MLWWRGLLAEGLCALIQLSVLGVGWRRVSSGWAGTGEAVDHGSSVLFLQSLLSLSHGYGDPEPTMPSSP